MHLSGFLLLLCVAGILQTDAWWRSRWRFRSWWRRPKVTGARIQQTADRYVGNTRWSLSSNSANGTTSDHSNYFVARVLKKAGARAPKIRRRCWSWFWCRWIPISAKQWGNPEFYYLKRSRCWNHVNATTVGDVISDGSHVGFVTGNHTTTSPNAKAVVKNDWGFREGNDVVAWRYFC